MMSATTQASLGRGLESKQAGCHSSGASAAEGMQNQVGSLILFLLDLGRSPAHSDFLHFARNIASQMAREWQDFFCDGDSHSPDPSFKDDLSHCAFALAEIWKVTRDPAYRKATLEMIQYANESGPRPMETVHQEIRR